MSPSKITAVAALGALALGAAAVRAQGVYIPPGTDRPLFGGEIALSQVGPVAGYWPTQCRTWSIRSQEHRDGPQASPEVNAVFQRFVSGLIAQHPDYEDMNPAMAKAVRQNLLTYWPSLNRMGQASAAKKVITDDAGNDVYVIDQKGGSTHWNIAVDRQGRIASAFICKGQGL